MQLFTDEKKVLSSDDEMVVLTNQRIYMKDKVWGRSHTITIFLEDISSIEAKYTSYIFFIALGVLSIAAGFYSERIECGVLAAIFFLMWWFSRKHTITIIPNGGATLLLTAEGMSDERIEEFIYKVSMAKSKRATQLNTKED